jgi:mRNA-degrading endonuclease YafQ of YafQ-DinJ toxin-antitoxin module
MFMFVKIDDRWCLPINFQDQAELLQKTSSAIWMDCDEAVYACAKCKYRESKWLMLWLPKQLWNNVSLKPTYQEHFLTERTKRSSVRSCHKLIDIIWMSRIYLQEVLLRRVKVNSTTCKYKNLLLEKCCRSDISNTM